MISRPSPASDISQREKHTWRCKNLRSTATESQESSSGHAAGALCCERAPLQNENRAANWSLAGVLHWDTGKVKGTPYPARGWARVRMSNVTKPLSMLATTTAPEKNTVSCWLFWDSSFLPVSSMLQRKASTVIFAQWTRAGFTIYYLATTFKKCIERTISLQTYAIIPSHYICSCPV